MANATRPRAERERRRAAGRPAQAVARPASGALPWLLLGLGATVLLLGLAGLVLALRLQGQQLIGPTVQDSPPAPNFALDDQDGRRIQLADLRGKVVALTFLYTQCPDVCPLIAAKLGEADQQLGGARDRAALLAVSVDPAHDTTAAVRAFDAAHQLGFANWHYLLGSRAALAPVWQRYFVGTDAAEAIGTPVAGATPAPGLVGHTAIVYLIDPQGRLRLALDADFAVADFVHDVRALAG